MALSAPRRSAGLCVYSLSGFMNHYILDAYLVSDVCACLMKGELEIARPFIYR